MMSQHDKAHKNLKLVKEELDTNFDKYYVRLPIVSLQEEGGWINWYNVEGFVEGRFRDYRTNQGWLLTKEIALSGVSVRDGVLTGIAGKDVGGTRVSVPVELIVEINSVPNSPRPTRTIPDEEIDVFITPRVFKRWLGEKEEEFSSEIFHSDWCSRLNRPMEGNTYITRWEDIITTIVCNVRNGFSPTIELYCLKERTDEHSMTVSKNGGFDSTEPVTISCGEKSVTFGHIKGRITSYNGTVLTMEVNGKNHSILIANILCVKTTGKEKFHRHLHANLSLAIREASSMILPIMDV